MTSGIHFTKKSANSILGVAVTGSYA